MIYLATPYSDPDPLVRQARFEVVTRVAAVLMSRGEMIISPISHSHPIAIRGSLPVSWKYWEAFDNKLLSICDKMIVLMQANWAASVGVKAEIELAKAKGLEIEHLFPEDILHEYKIDGRTITLKGREVCECPSVEDVKMVCEKLNDHS